MRGACVCARASVLSAVPGSVRLLSDRRRARDVLRLAPVRRRCGLAAWFVQVGELARLARLAPWRGSEIEAARDLVEVEVGVEVEVEGGVEVVAVVEMWWRWWRRG